MKLRNLLMVFGLVLMVAAGAVSAQQNGGAFLGVRLQDSDEGVVIREIVDGSPASAGLQVDDIITAINGEAVATAADVAQLVSASAPGEALTLTVTRGGESMDVEVELGNAPPNAVDPGRGDGRGGQPPFETMQVGIIYNPAEQVWEIRQLAEATPLYEAGLRAGDIVTAFNGEPRDLMTLRELVAASGNEIVTLTVTRETAEQEVLVPAPALVQFFAPMSLDRFEPVDPRGGVIPGFAMPTNGRLGVVFVTLDEETAAENEVDFVEGALIQLVDPDSAAAEAGLLEGDIVTAVNGEPVDQERTLRDRIYAYEPADVITLTVLRGGESMEVEVTLGEQDLRDFLMPDGDMPGFRMEIIPPDSMPPVAEMTPEPGMRPDVTPEAPGV